LIQSIFRRKHAGEVPGTDLLREQGPAPLLRVARQLLTAGRSDRALVLLRAGVLRYPGVVEVGELLANAERAEALPQMPSALETLEENASAKNHARVSHLCRRTGDESAALEHGRRAIQVDPRSPYGYRATGRVYLERFRSASRTVDGMNALRYYSKACALDPRHADSLLSLAEIFVLLAAPEAARRFLAPVATSHPDNPTVEILERRCRALPSEETSNVQELFLRHERSLLPGQPGTDDESSPAAVPSTLPDHLEEVVRAIDGSTGAWVIGPNRQIVAGYSSTDHADAEVAELGLVAETIRSNSSRMGVGQFEELVLRAEEQLVVVSSLGDRLTGFYFGLRPSRQHDVESAFERVGYSLAESKNGATS